jgi:hypothetical protein
MKKLTYIAIAILFSACANNTKEASVSDMDFSETEIYGNDNMELEGTAVRESTDLASAKLQDYFELVLLQQKHPEFKEDIRAQIQSLSERGLLLADSIPVISIENIRQNGAVQSLSDSLQKIQFYFDLTTENGVRADSITAVLRTQIVTLDEQKVTAIKVTFERN